MKRKSRRAVKADVVDGDDRAIELLRAAILEEVELQRGVEVLTLEW